MSSETGRRMVNKTLASDPLRQQAEREWIEADRQASKQQCRVQKEAIARRKRRQKNKDQKDEIVRLKNKLQEAKRELISRRRARQHK